MSSLKLWCFVQQIQGKNNIGFYELTSVITMHITELSLGDYAQNLRYYALPALPVDYASCVRLGNESTFDLKQVLVVSAMAEAS